MHRRARRERTIFYRELRAVCRFSYRHAYALVLLAIALSVPAFFEARNLALDTDLTRLLPRNSDAVRWSERLESAVGDGGYFSVIVEDGSADARRAAVDGIGARLRRLDGIESVDYRYPTDFLRRFSYALVPSEFLLRMQDEVADWEAQVNPFVDDFLDDDAAVPVDDGPNYEELLKHYQQLPEYHQDPAGELYGIIVHANQGISNLGGLKALYEQMGAIVQEEASAAAVTATIGGSLRTRVEEFDVIQADVARTGAVAIIAIMATLVFSFRSVRILPVLLFPLSAGLLWAFALVPTLVGDLNTITSFMLMVLFGMGVDYSVHLVKRYRHELVTNNPENALVKTFTSTGRSVATSGVTTSFGLLILAISDFRGFSDFGLIGGTAMFVVTIAMLLVMPATLVVGQRLSLVLARAPRMPGKLALPPAWAAATLSFLVLASAFASAYLLRFDYDFANFSANLEQMDAIKAKETEIYPVFFGPAAIYLAPDLATLDQALARIDEAKAQNGTAIGAISSVRYFAPAEAEWQRRLELIEELQDMLSGRWVRRIEDPDRLRLIEDVLAFTPPDNGPTVQDLPASIVDNLLARDGSGRFVLALNVEGPPKDGRLSMAFTREIYDLDMPDRILGPTGDKPVLAEILWLVTTEAPLIVVLTFLGVFVLVIIDRRDIQQATWVLVPLVASLLLTFGGIIVLGWKLNFFNMVVLPALLGLGVDHGVHYYRRWRELGRDTRATQLELFEPISVATLTTIMGYAGMALARHPGLRSIGILAILGLACTWVTALVLLPGLLGWRETHRDDDETAPAKRSVASDHGDADPEDSTDDGEAASESADETGPPLANPAAPEGAGG